MHILSGKYKGKALSVPSKVKIRPTSDKVKAALCNILRSRIKNARVLELYGGSGAVGLELLSAGAKEVVFVEKNRICASVLKHNIRRVVTGQTTEERSCCEHSEAILGTMPFGPAMTKKNNISCRVYILDAVKAIEILNRKNEQFDIVFMDPPYYKEEIKKCLLKISKCDILYCNGFVIAEHYKKDLLPEHIGKLKVIKQEQYGDTVLSFFQVIDDTDIDPN